MLLDIYERELDLVITELELELERLLKQYEHALFTDKVKHQITAIKTLIAKYKSKKEKLAKSTKPKSFLNYIIRFIQSILRLNSKLHIKQIKKQKNKKKQNPDNEKKEEVSENREQQVKDKEEQTESKSSKKQTTELSPKDKNKTTQTDGSFIHLPINSNEQLHPDLIRLLKLGKEAEKIYIQQHLDFLTPSESVTSSKTKTHLTDEIINHHQNLLKTQNYKPEQERQEIVQDNYFSNPKQLHYNYLILFQKLVQQTTTLQIKYKESSFDPLLFDKLLKLSVLKQIFEKYIDGLTLFKNKQIFKKHTGYHRFSTRIKHTFKEKSFTKSIKMETAQPLQKSKS